MNNSITYHNGRPLRITRHLRKVRGESVGFRGPTKAGLMTDTLSHWITAHYTAKVSETAEEAGDAGLSLDQLHEMVAVVSVLRRGDHSAVRLELDQDRNDIDREWIEIAREKSRKRTEEKFEQWMKEPEKHRRPQRHTMSAEERAERIRQILKKPAPESNGAAAKQAASANAPGTESQSAPECNDDCSTDEQPDESDPTSGVGAGFSSSSRIPIVSINRMEVP